MSGIQVCAADGSHYEPCQCPEEMDGSNPLADGARTGPDGAGDVVSPRDAFEPSDAVDAARETSSDHEDGAIDASPVFDGSDPGSDAMVARDSGSDRGDSGAVGGDSGVPLPPIDGVCVDKDGYEPNDTLAGARQLPVDSSGQALIVAGHSQTDPDYYLFSGTTQNPFTVELTYPQPPTGSTSSLKLYTYMMSQLGPSPFGPQTSGRLGVEFSGDNQALYYYIAVETTSPACLPYYLSINTRFCTDPYEDNRTVQQTGMFLPPGSYECDSVVCSYMVVLDDKERATVHPTIDAIDVDWFKFVPPKHEPIQVKASYDHSDPDLALALEVGWLNPQYQAVVTDPTKGGDLVFEPPPYGPPHDYYYVSVTSNKAGVCIPYDLTFDALWCTDAFEDNDDRSHAFNLPIDAQSATITSLDDDFYLMQGATQCIISYSAPAGSLQNIDVELLDQSGTVIRKDTTARTGPTETIRIDTTAPGGTAIPRFLHLFASRQECTSYTINCCNAVDTANFCP
jgi:hypothetical protein